MTNGRLVLIGAGAIALLFVGGVVAVLTFGGDGAPPAPAAEERIQPAPRAEALPRLRSPPLDPDAPTPPRVDVPRSVYSAMRVPTSRDGQVTAAERRAALRAARNQLSQGFQELRSRA